ncbi:hypothetical protein GF402_07805 [Candidatus Fermentibacteria bacterium]|nr:hypothetical protein [Candidatus Fermentibacteria bacterium]
MSVLLSRGSLALVVTVLVQLLLEVTLGRILVAPDVVVLTLVYLATQHDSHWAIAGAFWAGLGLDMLLHLPPGASVLGLLLGMRAAVLLRRSAARETGTVLVLMAMAASVIRDLVVVGLSISQVKLLPSYFPGIALGAILTGLLGLAMAGLRSVMSIARTESGA